MDDLTAERYPGDFREYAAEARRLRRHVFHPSVQRSYGQRICTCGSLEEAAIHRVPERTEEERDHEKRRTGER